MIIKDIPQTGKLGLTVTWPGRNGLIRRTLVTPANPRTASQTNVRNILAAQAARYDSLTPDQQAAWITAASAYQCRARLGQSGPLTGLQLFTKINCTLALLGQAPVDVPPKNPVFPALALTSLVITNAAGVIAITLTCPGDPGDATILRAAKPQRSGVRRCDDLRIIGLCPAPAEGSADITALYTAKFGAPVAGQRLFVAASVMVDGFESVPTKFSALVPVAA
jgi:hypothetical protein